MSGKDLQEIEEVWHGLTLPYAELFAWLDGTGRAARTSTTRRASIR